MHLGWPAQKLLENLQGKQWFRGVESAAAPCPIPAGERLRLLSGVEADKLNYGNGSGLARRIRHLAARQPSSGLMKPAGRRSTSTVLAISEPSLLPAVHSLQTDSVRQGPADWLNMVGGVFESAESKRSAVAGRSPIGQSESLSGAGSASSPITARSLNSAIEAYE